MRDGPHLENKGCKRTERPDPWPPKVGSRTKLMENSMNVILRDSTRAHRFYCESKQGIQFECHRINDDAVRKLAMSADTIITRIPGQLSRPDKSILELFEKLSGLVARRASHEPSSDRSLGEIAQLRRSVRLRANRHPLFGTFDAWVDDRPLKLLAVVIAPLSVDSCTLRTDIPN
jgi:hypothetical protein